MRIDNACFLDQGVLLNTAPDNSFEALPGPTSTHHLGITPHALLYWYTAASSPWLQAKHYPIKMLEYVHKLVSGDTQD
ncbi:hypothetical protein [Arthrobacter sp. HLT1-21]